jgi:hypothetical protein
MRGPGTRGSRAHAETTGELCLAGGCERRTLLVPHADPLYALVSPDGIRERIQSVTDHTEHLSRADVGQDSRQQFAYRIRHLIASWWMCARRQLSRGACSDQSTVRGHPVAAKSRHS